jgi:hypothetical protein
MRFIFSFCSIVTCQIFSSLRATHETRTKERKARHAASLPPSRDCNQVQPVERFYKNIPLSNVNGGKVA